MSQTQTLRKMLVVLAWSCYADADDIPPGESSLPKTSAHYIACEQVRRICRRDIFESNPLSWQLDQVQAEMFRCFWRLHHDKLPEGFKVGFTERCLVFDDAGVLLFMMSRQMEKLVMSRQHRS